MSMFDKSKEKDFPAEQLQLHIRVSIMKVRHVGDGQYSPSHSDHLDIEENVLFPPGDFTEMCAVLGQFHELAKKLRVG